MKQKYFISKMFIIKEILLKEQTLQWKTSNIFKIQGLVKVNQFVYINIISVNVAIFV